MFVNIRLAFETIINESEWIDDIAKQMILFKANQIKLFIGYPDILNDLDQLNKYYSDVLLTYIIYKLQLFILFYINTYVLFRSIY